MERCEELRISSCYKCDQWREELTLNFNRYVVQSKPRPKSFACRRLLRMGITTPVIAPKSTPLRIRISREKIIASQPSRDSRKRVKTYSTRNDFIWSEDELDQLIDNSDTPLQVEVPPNKKGRNDMATILPTIPVNVATKILIPFARGPMVSNQTTTKPTSTLPSVRGYVCSLIPGKWQTKQGSRLDKAMHLVVLDEASRNKNGTKSGRRINFDLLAVTLWKLMSFLYVGRWLSSKYTALAHCLFVSLYNKQPDQFGPILTRFSKQHIRREELQAWKFQRTIDLEGAGGLNYECLNSIRRGVEELKRNAIGLVPERTSVANTAKLLEEHASNEYLLGFKESVNQHGPTFTFDLDVLMRLVLTGHGLDVAAQTSSRKTHKPVIVAYTLDGAQLTNTLGHVTAGIKIVDPRALDPITGIPLHVSGKYQSRDLCFPTQITFGRDCKSLYQDCFQNFFEYFNGTCKVEGKFGLPELSNFRILSPQDMSSIWKTVGLGGGSHTKDFFCYCCSCQKRDIRLDKTNGNRCYDCKRLGVDRCFCHPVNDQSHIEELHDTLFNYTVHSLDEGYQKLAEIINKSTIETKNSESKKLTNPNHIEFEPTNERDSDNFKALLTKELKLRLTREGRIAALSLDLEGRRHRLMELITDEKLVLAAKETTERVESVHDIATKLLCEQAIPCILHAEMRVNEKLFYTLLSMALDRYPEGQAKKKRMMIDRVEVCMKTIVLGHEELGKGAQWKFPLKKGGKEVESRSLTGVQSRKCVLGMKTLATLIFAQELDQNSMNKTSTRRKNEKLLNGWTKLLDTFLEMMDLAKQHDDLSSTDLDKIHILSQAFMASWIDLGPNQAVSNYIHMFGASHMTYFLKRYGNLYRFSQQGWEALNQKLKHFYFHNTNHGGCTGNTGNMLRGDHVRPLMRMCQRFIMWRLGFGTSFFLNLDRLPIVTEEFEEEMIEPICFGGAFEGMATDTL